MVNVPTFVEIPGFAGSGSRIQPPEPLYSNGYLPGQTLPAEYENFFLNGFSLNGLSEQVSIVSVVTELTNFLTAYGTTPNPALFNQFLTTMQAQLALKANLASPTFTGTVTIPAVPEPTIASNPATKTYVDSVSSALSAEAALARNADNLSSGTVPGLRFTAGGIQIITSGSGNFVVPANVYTIKVTLIGAGGGGGAGTGTPSATGGGGGGGGGISTGVLSVTPAQSVAYSVGAGGAGGITSGSGDGSTGGNTTFTGVTTATGGGGGGGSSGINAGGSGGTGNVGSKGSGGAQGNSSGGAGGAGGAAGVSTGPTGGSAGDLGGGGGGSYGATAGADGGNGIIIVEW